MIVEGQVHGGIAQGVGQALLESAVYDPERAARDRFLQDYCMPRADDLPSFRVGMTETPCPHNPLGAKGCGEAGAIAAPAALMNAITDALGTEIQMPATREKVWARWRSSAWPGGRIGRRETPCISSTITGRPAWTRPPSLGTDEEASCWPAGRPCCRP